MKRFLFCASLVACATFAEDGVDGDIPYTRFVLENGLTLIVHEDHKAPIVAVNVWYHVGSKNEQRGRTGLAHLFEHLMFNGSEHFNDDYFKAIEKVGATELNGTTSEDRTNYFQNVPKAALDTVLWLESDRMGHFLGALTQKRLDEQRGVVQNEKRQGDNQPYSIAQRLITENVWPAKHPYSWQVIGSMEDLSAATLEDARKWFTTYYGAANATLVVAGDVTAAEVHERVKRHFGWIPSGPALARHTAWIAKRQGSHRQRAEDRIPQARLYKVWNVPPYGTHDETRLEMVASVLSEGSASRLYKRLVYDERIATSVSAWVDTGEIAGTFCIVATATPGIALDRVEKAIDEELARFLKTGPTGHELDLLKAKIESNFIRSLERIGGFGGKSDLLAMNSVYLDNPAYYKTRLTDMRQTTSRQLKEHANTWLSDGQYVLELHPFPDYRTGVKDVDRTTLPVPRITPEVRFPALRRLTLANGLDVVVAQRPDVPLVEFTLLAKAGFSADPIDKRGLASLTMTLLNDGTRQRDAQAMDDALALLGASIGTSCSLDSCSIALSTLKKNMDKALTLYCELLREPGFRENDFLRRQEQQQSTILREVREPLTHALRRFPEAVYGQRHAYGGPLTGSGTPEGVRHLTAEDCRTFHRNWIRPGHATLIVAGDVSEMEIRQRLEKLLGDWKRADTREIHPIRAPEGKPAVFLIDRPGASQSAIVAGNVAAPWNPGDHLACELMNQILGGAFTSRINLNLREEKNWTYGARSSIQAVTGPRLFTVSVQVQADKTKETLQEIARELREVCTHRPITEKEFEVMRGNMSLKLFGAWETLGSVSGALGDSVRFGLPDDYFQKAPERFAKITCAEVVGVTRQIIHPEAWVWVVVGDCSKIEQGIRALDLGPVTVLPDSSIEDLPQANP